MPLYNFKRRFGDLIRTGHKCQTIRSRGKRPPPKPGQIAHCYTGLRTQDVCWLGEFPITSVEPISISAAARIVSMSAGNRWRELDSAEVVHLARADGFTSVADFFAFFSDEHGGTFSGYLIKWCLRDFSTGE
ncbi:MAG: hypothetical protein AzoDbin1_04108 [Azoarcus sp.]|nr:hypothetical protein [Azoarcus sp.]